jgi:ribosomal-protein-alanine N-acetyltransferase
MKIDYRPADETSAREFLQWRYEPPYDLYNCLPADLEEALQYNIDPKNNVYAMYDPNADLVGYCSYGRMPGFRAGITVKRPWISA